MKALAVDCATNRLSIGVKNDDKFFSVIYDIGMHQSKTLVSAIDYALKQVDLCTKDLDFTCLCLGPGSFTGLRIAISALKAIELANNVPVYGISSLETYASPFRNIDIPVLACLDAKKDKFYGALYSGKTTILEDGDYEVSELAEKVKNYDKVFIAGPDSLLLKELLEKENTCKETIFFAPLIQSNSAETLLSIAEQNFSSKEPSLQDYDGPIYLRASEAEIKLNQ